MTTVGIDIGGPRHAVACCRAGRAKADREVLWVSQDRAGFDRLDGWLAREEEPVEQVAMGSSGHYWMPLASHLQQRGVPVALVNPLSAKYFAKSHLGRTKSDPETSWHMSKAGNAHLRAAAYRLAVVGVIHNPVIKAHYERKRKAGKSKMNALGHCMSKALSLVWGVWRNDADFDPDWGSRA